MYNNKNIQGKSYLVQKLKYYIQHPGKYPHFSERGNKGLFVQGSFSDTISKSSSGGSGMPYAAFTYALEDLIDDLIHCGIDLEQLRKNITEVIGTQNGADMLADIIPNIWDMLELSPPARNPRRRSLYGASDAGGLHFIVRSFIKAISNTIGTTDKGPLVILLDSAEFADFASIDLISSLVTDTESKNLLVILNYRDDVLNDDHPLISSIELIKDLNITPVTEIHVQNLTINSVNRLIAGAMRQRDLESSIPLADIIHEKTLGNSFFVVSFLRSLIDLNLLFYSVDKFGWEWDIQRIRDETKVSENVGQLLANRTKSLTEDIQVILKIAVCLHSTIDPEILQEVVNNFFDISNTSNFVALKYMKLSNHEKCVLPLLDNAVKEGFLVRLNSRKGKIIYKFAHGKVEESLRSQIDEGTHNEFIHLRIGSILRDMKDRECGKTWMLFACIEQFNSVKSSMFNKNHSIDLVRLNLEAGEKAVKMSAYVPATNYLQEGINLIDLQNQWNAETYDLCLHLYTNLAISQYCNGNFDICEMVCNRVITEAHTLTEKIRCYCTKIAYLKASNRMEETVEVGIKLLSELGEKFKTNPSKKDLKSELKKTEKLMKNHNEESLMSLPECSDEHKAAAVHVLGLLFGPLFHLGFSKAVDILRLKTIQLTIQYGVCEASALAYAYYGSHLISSQCNIAEGYKFGKLALQLIERINGNEHKSRTILLAYFMIMHWKDPLQTTFEPLLAGYKAGMIYGDIEMAFTCAGVYYTHLYYSGMHLESGEKDLNAFCKEMKTCNQMKELRTYLPLRQCVLNLMGKSLCPTTMTGDAMNEKEFEKGKIGVVVMWSYQMQLAYYFDNLTLAEELVTKLRPHSEGLTAPFFQIARRFFFSLILMGCAKKSPKKKRYIKEAKFDIDWLKKRVECGAINCLHKLLILEAELLTLDAKASMIRQTFDKAIMSARKTGFTQDEALGNELAGKYFLSQNDSYWAEVYLSRAITLYSEWGANGKVSQLKQQSQSILGDINENSDRRSIRIKKTRRTSSYTLFKSSIRECSFDDDE